MIPKAQSLYLDTVRILCAFGVLLWHASQLPVSDGAFISPPGHLFVVVFFVLSGFVIAASTDRPACTWRTYSADRISRLSCVVIPGLLLTYLLDAIGNHLAPFVYQSIDRSHQFLRFFFNFTYLQQHWFLCVNPSSNQPFWSIAYEFWYYVIYGTWLFIYPLHIRLVTCGCLLLFVGPKIVLLFPCWLAGVIAYHLGKTLSPGPRTAIPLFSISATVVFLGLIFPEVTHFYNGLPEHAPLFRSTNFLGDCCFSLFVATNFFFTFQLSFGGVLSPFEGIVRWIAQRTFSLYIFHLPILWFLRATINYNTHDFKQVFISILATVGIAFGVSAITEQYYPFFRLRLREYLEPRQAFYPKNPAELPP